MIGQILYMHRSHKMNIQIPVDRNHVDVDKSMETVATVEKQPGIQFCFQESRTVQWQRIISMPYLTSL